MPKEIERKFLIKDMALVPTGEEERITQGYLPTDDGMTARIRFVNDQSVITIKGPNQGISRDEYEFPIPADQAKEIMERYCGQVITKVRRKIPDGAVVWEVDFFQGDNYGLVFAEVELKSASQKIAKPSWIGKEVSDLHRYHNAHLAKHPFKDWSKKERAGE